MSPLAIGLSTTLGVGYTDKLVGNRFKIYWSVESLQVINSNNQGAPNMWFSEILRAEKPCACAAFISLWPIKTSPFFRAMTVEEPLFNLMQQRRDSKAWTGLSDTLLSHLMRAALISMEPHTQCLPGGLPWLVSEPPDHSHLRTCSILPVRKLAARMTYNYSSSLIWRTRFPWASKMTNWLYSFHAFPTFIL